MEVIEILYEDRQCDSEKLGPCSVQVADKTMGGRGDSKYLIGNIDGKEKKYI